MLEKALPLVLLVLVVAELAYGAVFTYYSAKINASPVPPPVVLGAVGAYCSGMARTARTAIAYTDFETSPSGWASMGGSWSLTTGYKGYGLMGKDNNQGIGGESQYYYNTRLDSYSSLWVTVKAQLLQNLGGKGWYGLALIDSSLSSMFAIEIYDTRGYVEIWYYGPNGSSRLNYSTITGYTSGSWYTIVAYYNVSSTSTTINATVYDVNGRAVGSVTWSGGYYLTPSYLGVVVGGAHAVFDDFEISTGDPRFVTVNNTIPGYSISIGDNLGNIVASATASSSTTQLSVVTDIVVGTGTDGNITVYYPSGAVCLVYKPASGDTILGGDVYLIQGGAVVYLGANYTSANVTATISTSSTSMVFLSVINNDSSKSYYARLILDSSTSTVSGLTCNVTLYNPTTTSTPITVSSGQVVYSSTSFIQIPAGGSANLSFTGYASSTGLTMRLNMLLEYCSQPNEQGVCVYYPVSLTLNS
jgi:hypothetical protein